METRKLSDVLAQLQQKQGEANDKIIMSRGGQTYGTSATDMYPATENNSGAMTAEHVKLLSDIKSRLTSIVGDATLIALSDLDNFDRTILRKQGWYVIGNNQNIPVGHMLITSDPHKHVLYQVVFGNYTIVNDAISENHHDGKFNILIRGYGVLSGSGEVPVGTWTKWKYYQQNFIRSQESDLEGEDWTYGHTKIDEIIKNVADVNSYTEQIKNIIVGSIGSYEAWTDAHTALDGMITSSSNSGRYIIKVGGVPYYVTFTLCSKEKKVYWQMIEGGIVVKSDGTLATDTTKYCTFVSRYYENGVWSAWKVSAKKEDIPTVQSGTKGTNANYVYSNSSDNSHGCLSGTFKAFQYNHGCYIRHKFWGSSDDYSSDNLFVTREIPYVNTGANGVFEYTMLLRMRNFNLKETNSTTTTVNINYPIPALGTTATLSLTAATSAKAGVMTAAQYNQLKSLGEAKLNDRVTNLEITEAGVRLEKIEKHYKYLGHFDSEDAALAKLIDLSVCANTELLHAHLTYDDGSHTESSIILIQSVSGSECRQIIYNKTKAFHRGVHFTDVNRTEISYNEEWQFLFGDRLQWSTDGHKYVLSQFGQGFNHSITDPIPLATDSVDGLMSKEDKALLDKIKKQLNL